MSDEKKKILINKNHKYTQLYNYRDIKFMSFEKAIEKRIKKILTRFLRFSNL